ncbi:MAG: GNAT family N-acetyltransferase [Gammaproteobacteria bacterium]|nr:GNAT family N-acetyltransferase [Gammaproteobacteria bacterium]MCF6260571.1 GNAT family N-acetyltransferase [Gammaproteobacteria bacterium]
MIEEVTSQNFEEVLPLIKEYQIFYDVEKIDEKKNQEFFSQFTQSHENGILHLYKVANKAIGFTTIYKGFSSTRSEAVAILNDLYIQPPYRGNGYAKELIDNAVNTAKLMGFSRLQWLTSENNESAQKLYNKIGANKSSWFFYAKET